MDNKEKIINLYYNNHLKISNIENLLHISHTYIARIIKKDARYETEQINRQNTYKKDRQAYQTEFMRKKREKQRYADNYNIVKQQHIQASKELSKVRHLTNESYRKWNYSAYKYNPSKKRYEFDENLVRSYDVPKFIKER